MLLCGLNHRKNVEACFGCGHRFRVWHLWRYYARVQVCRGHSAPCATHSVALISVEPQNSKPTRPSLLGGSWVVISGVISPLIWVITIVTLLITPLKTTHEPPSSAKHLRGPAWYLHGPKESCKLIRGLLHLLSRNWRYRKPKPSKPTILGADAALWMASPEP